MRQPPVVLITRDPVLAAECRTVAATAGCPLDVVETVGATHLTVPMTGRVLVGADVSEALTVIDAADVVALEHHERVPDRRVWLLPSEREGLARSMTLLAPRPPEAPTLAVMGAAGGVGASTLARGMATALLPAAGRAGVTLLQVAAVPDPIDPATMDPAPLPVERGRRSGMTLLETTGHDRLDRDLRAACEHAAVVVVDLPRWCTPWLGHVDSVVVLTVNRANPLRATGRLLAAARGQGLEPLLALACVPGGWWPRDVAAALGVEPAVVWPSDRRLAQADEAAQVDPVLARGRLNRLCTELSEAALATRGGGSPRW